MFKMDDVGRRISVMRKNAGLTQMELANKLGISYQAVSNWERGVAMPDISNLGALAKILGVTVDDIIGDEKISSIIEGKPVDGRLSVDEFNAVSPLLGAEKNRELLEKIELKTVNEADGKEKIDLSTLSLTDDEEEKLIREAYEKGDVALFAVLGRGAKSELNEELFAKACGAGNIPFAAILSKKVSEKARLDAFRAACDSGNIALVAILNPAKEKYADGEDDEEDENDEN